MSYAIIKKNHDFLYQEELFVEKNNLKFSSFYAAKVLLSKIERIIDVQVKAIVGHSTFHELHCRWIGLYYLVDQTDKFPSVIIKFFDISWENLKKDLLKHTEFEETHLFRYVYTAEYDMPGGRPFNILIGDYYVDIRDHHEVEALENIGAVCQAAYCTFLVSTYPFIFGINSFSEMDMPFDLMDGFETHLFRHWKKFRKLPVASFVGICLPRLLFDEYYKKKLHKKLRYLSETLQHYWGNAVYGLAAMIAECFDRTGWFLESTSLQYEAGELSGGIVPAISAPFFSTDLRHRVYQYTTEFLLTEQQERDLQLLGFIALCHCKHTAYGVFYHLSMTKEVITNEHGDPDQQQLIAASLPYLLCVCRFVHYIKIMGREKIGSHVTFSELQSEIRAWIYQYIASNSNLSAKMKAKFPLRDANVSVYPHPLRPDALGCSIEITPHMRSTQTTASICLQTTIIGQRLR